MTEKVISLSPGRGTLTNKWVPAPRLSLEYTSTKVSSTSTQKSVIEYYYSNRITAKISMFRYAENSTPSSGVNKSNHFQGKTKKNRTQKNNEKRLVFESSNNPKIK